MVSPDMKTTLALVLAASTVCGCAVGPDYAGPPRMSLEPGFVRADDVSSSPPTACRWWTTMGDSVLDRLVEAALSGNPGLAQALARVTQAQALTAQTRSQGLPSLRGSAVHIDASLPDQALRAEDGAHDLHLSTYSLGLSASWEPDLFGRVRRTLEQDRAKAEAAKAGYEDLKVSLAAEVVAAYVDLRDQQARLTWARDCLSLQEEKLRLIAQRRLAGTTSQQSLEAGRIAVEQARADVAGLQSDVERSLNRLAILGGRAPGALDPILNTATPPPLPPAEVAVGEPRDLLRRRPDIRQAERTLASASASIGVAASQYFPAVSFTGLLGVGGARAGDVFDANDLSRIALPMLNWTLLDFGAIHAQVDQARAGTAEAEAAYQSAVLAALEDAEGALSRFGQARHAYLAATRASEAAQRSAELVRQMRQAGVASRTDEIDAHHQRLIAAQQQSQSRADVAKAYAAVQKSLGLGWDA